MQNTPSNVPPGAFNIYSESNVDSNPHHTHVTQAESFGQQYTVPISAGVTSNSMPFPELTDGHQYHELEPNSEVMDTTGHHYHLLDVRL